MSKPNTGDTMQRFSTSLLGEAQTLLLTTDGSPYSDGAVQEAIFFGQAYSAKVVALHVIKTTAESLKSAEATVRMRRQELEPYLEQLRKMAADSGVEMEIVVIGARNPEEAIIEQAYLRKADVILMGRHHGKTGGLSLLTERMTAKVLDLGFPQILVVPKDFIIAGARVLLATDDSPGTQRAVAEAISLGRRSSTLQNLTILSVAKRDADVQAMQQKVENLCLQFKQADAQVSCQALVLVGDPGQCIVKAAKEQQTDMILIGGRGKRGVARMLLGRVTRKVTGSAHCAVLVINTL